MKFINIFIFSSILLTTCGCAGGVVDVVTEPLTGKSIYSDNRMYPRLFVGNIAVGRDKNSWAGVVAEMTSDTCSTDEKLFHSGKGHNEFGRILYAKDRKNSLMLLNTPLMGDKLLSVTVIDKADNLKEMKNTSNWKRYNLSSLPAFSSPADFFVPVSDSTILVAGSPMDDLRHIMSVIDYKNQVVYPLDYWPEKGLECSECNDFPKHNFYTENCRLFGNNQGHYFYHLQGWDRFSFIFSIEGRKVNIIKQLYSDVSEYEINKKNGAYRVTQSSAGMYSCANEKNIYLLLQNYNKDENGNDENPAYGDIVEVYDWDGNKQKEIKLDHRVNQVIVSDDNKTLFALRYGDKREMWTYKLNE